MTIQEYKCSSIFPKSKSSLCDGLRELKLLDNMCNESLNVLTVSDDEGVKQELNSNNLKSSKCSLNKSEEYHSNHSSVILVQNEHHIDCNKVSNINNEVLIDLQYKALVNLPKKNSQFNCFNNKEFKRSETIDCGIAYLAMNDKRMCDITRKFIETRTKFESKHRTMNVPETKCDFILEQAFGKRFLYEAEFFFNDNVRNLIQKFECPRDCL